MSDFNEKIVKWVTLDNELNRLRDDMRELRQEKSELKNEIYTYAEQNELDRAVIKISDGQLRTGGLIFAIIGFVIIWYLKYNA